MDSQCTGSQTQPSQGLSVTSRDGNGATDQISELSREWMQSLMSQAPMHPFTEMPHSESLVSATPVITAMPDIARSTAADQTASSGCGAVSSDSDSDDFSKSLSFFLSQHLSQQNSGLSSQQMTNQIQQQQEHLGAAAKRAHVNCGMLPVSNAGSAFGSEFTNIFDIGYDDRRRIINMPNPLGNLSLDIPINPQPVQPMLGMELVGAHQAADKHPMYGVQAQPQTQSQQRQHQQNMLMASMACARPRSLDPAGTGFAELQAAKTVGGDTTTLTLMPTPTPMSRNMVTVKAIADSSSRSALGISGSKRSKLSSPATTLAGPISRSVSMVGGLTANSKPRRGRPPLASKRAASAGKALSQSSDHCGGGGVFGIQIPDEATQISVPGTP
ncbi:hypothetical protein FB639_003135, partial [Coemansia asiatica]